MHCLWLYGQQTFLLTFRSNFIDVCVCDCDCVCNCEGLICFSRNSQMLYCRLMQLKLKIFVLYSDIIWFPPSVSLLKKKVFFITIYFWFCLGGKEETANRWTQYQACFLIIWGKFVYSWNIGTLRTTTSTKWYFEWVVSDRVHWILFCSKMLSTPEHLT